MITKATGVLSLALVRLPLLLLAPLLPSPPSHHYRRHLCEAALCNLPHSAWLTSPITVGGIPGSGTRSIVAILERVGVKAVGDENFDSKVCACQTVQRFISMIPKCAYPGTTVLDIKRCQSKPRHKPAIDGALRRLKMDLNFLKKNGPCVPRSHPSGCGKSLIKSKCHLHYLNDLRRGFNQHKNSTSTFSSTPWGIKQPGLMFCFSAFQEMFEHSAYVHVIRDGRDIAIGKSAGWLKAGPFQNMFGRIQVGETGLYDQMKILMVWAKVNLGIMKYAAEHYDANLAIVRLEDILSDDLDARKIAATQLSQLLNRHCNNALENSEWVEYVTLDDMMFAISNVTGHFLGSLNFAVAKGSNSAQNSLSKWQKPTAYPLRTSKTGKVEICKTLATAELWDVRQANITGALQEFRYPMVNVSMSTKEVEQQYCGL